MRKTLLRGVALLLVIALLAVVYSSLSFRQRANGRPLPAQWKKGVYHVHSLFSDGRGSVADIARAARLAGLDFVILTDHGRPNRGSSAATGWSDGVLIAGASEFSTNEGHLAAAGYRVPSYIFPPEAREAVAELERDNGVTFVAHPFDGKIPWRGWQVRGFTGIEIISLYQMAKKNLLRALTLFPLQYALNRGYALTSLLSYPRRELEAWDRLNRVGRTYGVYALDSHAKLALAQERSLHFPSYESTFKILNVYVKVPHGLDRDAGKATAEIFAALRAGNFFSAIEALAPANGFDCHYLRPDGQQVAMGGSAPDAGGALVVRTPFPFATDVVVKRDGVVFASVRDNTRSENAFPIAASGVYRVEVFLGSGRFRHLPWILANPMFVAMPLPAAPATETIAAASVDIRQECFQVEKNLASEGAVTREAGNEGPVTRLAFTLHREPDGDLDFWVALACREKTTVAGFHGFVFEVRADRRMRVWLQFRGQNRGNEAAFQRSFPADETWRRVAIPFSELLRLYGQGPVTELRAIDSFFFLVDNGNAYPGTRGELFLRRIGLY